jgi:DNA-nicking Smr family endonuclease
MRTPPDDEEFRKALAGVEPLAEPRRKPLARPRPAPLPTQTRRDERAALAESLHGPLSVDDAIDSGAELVYARDGLAREVLRKLRRGHWVIEDEIDLHGMNRAQAAEAVAAFLRHCVQRRLRCVRIVHGKGLRSRNREPVLKRKLGSWLMLRDEVLAFCEARPADGGSGAVVVLLRG